MDHFPIIILIGRPASGKSEIIDFLENLGAAERLHRFHTADMIILDDFPMLWTWFEEDDILENRLGKPRLHTDEHGYFKYHYQWNLLIERVNLEYQKRLRDLPTYNERYSTIIEFARGTEHGGYRDAFAHLSPDILAHSAVLYVRVSFAESLRKNRRRFNPERPDSILEHSLPDEKLNFLYEEDDWDELAKGGEKYLQIGPIRIPYAVFENEDDVTTGDPDGLGQRLELIMENLWQARLTFRGE